MKFKYFTPFDPTIMGCDKIAINPEMIIACFETEQFAKKVDASELSSLSKEQLQKKIDEEEKIKVTTMVTLSGQTWFFKENYLESVARLNERD